MSACPFKISFVLPDLGGGGAQRVMLNIAGRLDPERFSARILVAGRSQTLADSLPPSIPVTIGGHHRLRSALPWMIGRLRELRPDACVSVMGYMNLALLAARPALPPGTSMVVREANAVAATIDALPAWLRSFVPGTTLYRLLYSRSDAIIAPSPQIIGELSALLPAARGNMEYIPNPVDVAALRAMGANVCREPGSGLRLVGVGRLAHQKGYDRLLPLFAQLPADSHLTILGEGRDRSALEAQVRDLDLTARVSMPGYSHESARWIGGADALLLPSRWEGLPNVALEALALGTPVLASKEASLQTLERLCQKGAVTVRELGPPFLDAMSRLASSAVSALPRSNLLPEEFEASAVAERWASLLGRVCGERRNQNGMDLTG